MPDGPDRRPENERGPAGARWLRILVPLALSAAAVGVVGLLWGWARAGEVLVAGLTSIVAGTAIVFGPTVVPEISLGTWHLVAVLAWVTVVEAYLYAWNLDVLERIPKVGPWIARSRRDAREVLRQRPWIETLAAAGVALYVLLPLPASGTLVGCLIGHVIGLSPMASFLGTTIGALGAAVAYALLGEGLQEVLDAADVGTPVRILGAAVALAVGFLIVRTMSRMGRRASSPRPSDRDAG